LLHAGDLSQYGTFDEIQNQLDWLNQQPHRWKVVIAGNHDLLLDPVFVDKHPDRELDKPGKSCGDLRWGDVIYLQNSAVRVEVSAGKKIKIFGSPWTPRFGNVAFQYDGDDHNIWEGVVPPDTDILLTHGPPAGHLDDDGKSCKMLLRELWRLQPRLVVFGHIHPGRGESVVWYGDVEASYERVICDQKPWVSLLVMAWSLLLLLLRYRPCPSSRLVNAAVLGQSREAIITSI
jgi:predicted phosphodiesterase